MILHNNYITFVDKKDSNWHEKATQLKSEQIPYKPNHIVCIPQSLSYSIFFFHKLI